MEYFSSKYSSQECNNEIYDKELLTIVKALEEWRPELKGSERKFDKVKDHKYLEYFMTMKALNQRQIRWSELLSSYNFRIIYRPGSKAIRPDALSIKSEDRPKNSNPSDDRIRNRERMILQKERVDPRLWNK